MMVFLIETVGLLFSRVYLSFNISKQSCSFLYISSYVFTYSHEHLHMYIYIYTHICTQSHVGNTDICMCIYLSECKNLDVTLPISMKWLPQLPYISKWLLTPIKHCSKGYKCSSQLQGIKEAFVGGQVAAGFGGPALIFNRY